MRKGSSKYDWISLKEEFLQGPWEEAEDFMRDKQEFLPKNTRETKIRISSWATEKGMLMPTVVEKASLTLVDHKVKQLKKMEKRHVKMARLMQNRGKAALETLEPQDTEEARKLLLTGMEQERVALGATEKGGTSNLTQVNVNLPKTKFDEILDGGNIEDLLGLIANIRQEKARRDREKSLNPE